MPSDMALIVSPLGDQRAMRGKPLSKHAAADMGLDSCSWLEATWSLFWGVPQPRFLVCCRDYRTAFVVPNSDDDYVGRHWHAIDAALGSQRLMDRYGRDVSCRRNGFALIEALVALALVSLALLMGMAILLRQPRAQSRLDAGGGALRAIEASVETLRATPGLTLDGRRLTPGLEYPESPDVDGLQVWLESAAEDGPEGLWRISLEARYLVGKEPHRKRLETLLWRSP